MDNRLDLSKLEKDYEDKAYVAIAVSYFEQSEKLDQLMTWILAFVGGTTALLIANIDKIEKIAGINNLKISFGLLLISGVFGMISKINGSTVQLILGIMKQLNQTMKSLIVEYDQRKAILKTNGENYPDDLNNLINMDNVIKRIQSSVPRLLQWVYKDLIARGKEDSLVAIKIGLNMYYKQQMNMIICLGLLLLSLIYLVISI